MEEIYIMSKGHERWNETMIYANQCLWKAGPHLAKAMEDNEFANDERVIVACIDGNIAGYCTFTHKDELPEIYDFSPFIGFMFVDEIYRGNRLSEHMINVVCSYAKKQGYLKMHIMSSERGLYEKYGFKKIGDYETVYGSIDQLFERLL